MAKRKVKIKKKQEDICDYFQTITPVTANVVTVLGNNNHKTAENKKMPSKKIAEKTNGVTLTELSSPKPTTGRFYLLNSNGDKLDERYNNASCRYTRSNKLRGRKVYLHHRPKQEESVAIDRDAHATMDADYRFFNPYNFVRLLKQRRPLDNVMGSCLPPTHDRYTGFSGRIECAVELVTPLFISDAHARKSCDEEHFEFRTFEINGEKIVPASSLRGMLRSVYEMATNSCFGVLDAEKRLTYRADTKESSNLVPIRIEQISCEKDEEYIVLELLSGERELAGNEKSKPMCAARIPVYSRQDNRNIKVDGTLDVKTFHGQKLYADLKQVNPFDTMVMKISEKEFEGAVEGYVYVTNENAEKKKCERFFYKKGNRKQRRLEKGQAKSLINRYRDLLADYFERNVECLAKDENGAVFRASTKDDVAVPALSSFLENKNNMDLKVGDLLYAEFDENFCNIKNFVPVSIPRVTHEMRIGDMIDKDHRHCSSAEKLCPACRLFGWVKKSKDEENTKTVAYKGRVTISNGCFKKVLAENDCADSRFMGDETAKTLRNRTVRNIIAEGNVFEFAINFESLQQEELGALLWSLELDGGLHKLGYGKPLGFGSLKIKVKNIEKINYLKRYIGFNNDRYETLMELKTDFENTFKECMVEHYHEKEVFSSVTSMQGLGKLAALLPKEDNSYSFEKLVNISDILAIAKKIYSEPVHYPRPNIQRKKDGKQYEWFINNNRDGNNNAGQTIDFPHADEVGMRVQSNITKKVIKSKNMHG